MKKANAEAWAALRRAADSRSTAQAQQKTADTASDNAVKKQRIASMLLDAAIETIEAYRAKGQMKPNDIKLLSGVLKDFEGTALASSAQDDPLTKLLARWDDASKQ
jgi:2-iminoacetate synthase ThiH